MDKILRQIANTIVANLANTVPIGLFDGKLGLALFLYKYSRYSASQNYEDIASDLLDDMFEGLKLNMSPSAIDGIASIGYGLTILLKECFLESDPDEDVLRDVDEVLLNRVKPSLMQEVRFPIPLYSSGIYLLSRLPYSDKEVEKRWTDQVVENAIDFVHQGVKRGKVVPKLSLLNSMLYVFKQMRETNPMYSERLEQLLAELLDMSAQAIRSKDYQELDVLLLKQNIRTLPFRLKEKKHDVIGQIEQMGGVPEGDRLDFWYDTLWWSILYGVPVVEGVTPEAVKDYIDRKIQESYFDEMTVNSKLAAAGLWMLGKVES